MHSKVERIMRHFSDRISQQIVEFAGTLAQVLQLLECPK
jgi:hypothetical protein